MLLVFNWAKQIVKIARDFEPALGEPLLARRASVSIPFRASRTKLGLTQDDSAKKADIKYTTLMKVESGTVNKPSVRTMAKIAIALGVSIKELLK